MRQEPAEVITPEAIPLEPSVPEALPVEISPPVVSEERRAFITLVTSDNYALGALVLLESLRTVQSRYPLLILTVGNYKMSEKLQNALTMKGATFRYAEPIDIPSEIHSPLPRWVRAFNKLRIVEQVDYDKLVWIDADDIVIQNVDDLFENHLLSAPPDFNGCERSEGR